MATSIWLPTGCRAKLTLKLCASRRAARGAEPKSALIIWSKHVLCIGHDGDQHRHMAENELTTQVLGRSNLLRRRKALRKLLRNDFSRAPSSRRSINTLGQDVVVELLSRPEQCLFAAGNPLSGPGSFPLLRKIIAERCAELRLPEEVTAAAQADSMNLLNDALNCLFKARM